MAFCAGRRRDEPVIPLDPTGFRPRLLRFLLFLLFDFRFFLRRGLRAGIGTGACRTPRRSRSKENSNEEDAEKSLHKNHSFLQKRDRRHEILQERQNMFGLFINCSDVPQQR